MYDNYRVGRPWSSDEDKQLVYEVRNGNSLLKMCKQHSRNAGGIRARIIRLIQENELLFTDTLHLRETSHSPIEFPSFNKEPGIAFELQDVIDYEINTERKSNMNKDTWTMVSLLQTDVITVAVQFNGSSRYYTYKTRDASIEELDYVVVFAQNEFKVAQIMEVHEEPQFDLDSGIKYQWIVQKVTTNEYENNNIADRQAYDLLVNAEKHVAKKKLVEMYTESLGLEDKEALQNLLAGKITTETDDEA